ncbi:MAG: type II secretion system protein, partial [Firmicutes bacterium]|nr:type II secretion system protein [Bacillota bacterium]
MITKREKQKRGFTMIELLAVLVILGIIMVIAVPSVVGYLQDSKQKYYEQLEDSVMTAGKEYFSDHRSLLPRENGQIYSVDIADLVTDGYTSDVLD